LVDPSPYRQGFIRLFPSFYRSRIDYILLLCEDSLENWLISILFRMGTIALCSFIGLLILGIPTALALALLAGLLAFIPNIGPLLSVIPPMAIALLDSPWKSLAVLILYLVIQQIESQIIAPRIMNQESRILPGITLLSQLFFASFFGFLGLFLALPLSLVSQVLLKEILIKDVLDKIQSPTRSSVLTNISEEDKLSPDKMPSSSP
jgi:predicted PurR-regulated permease PerM